MHKLEKLLIAQSNLSRSIKELENDIGITIFERSPKGVTLTAEGDEFIRRSRSLLSQMSDIEDMYKRRSDKSVSFSVSVPRASYVSEAFLELNEHLSDKQTKLYFKQSNAVRTIESVLDCSCNIGIIRSEKRYYKFFYDHFRSKGLSAKQIGEYRYRVTAGHDSVIAGFDSVTFDDLRPLTQVAFADPYVPYVSVDTVLESETTDGVKSNIFVVENMSASLILLEDPMSFMWSSPISRRSLDKYGFVQKECTDLRNIHSDILIWRTNYRFTDTDTYFIDAVKRKAEDCGMTVHR